ncbi:MAG: helix-hairpin-helix domain-containing protein [Candidatus Endonucleobacter sp. (ex Gigantidas childressi)]|nr:helix-hairpin-helix domain-containing protein [Candidatus Endonucleobacter sp. (ex Gigantidas childressi)]
MLRNFITPLLIAILSFSSLAYAEKSSEKININTASAAMLDKELKYVGEAIAERIVQYRKKHGDFTTIEELSNVRGIGKKVVEANKMNVVTK